MRFYTRFLPIPIYIQLALIFLLSFAIRVIFIVNIKNELANDLFWNDAVGWNLAQGNGFTASLSEPYVHGIFRTPAYPAFLAAIYFIFGHSVTVVYFGQAIIDSFTAVLLAMIVSRLLAGEIAIMAGITYATYPYSAYFCGYLHQDILLTFATVATLFLTIEASKTPKSKARWFIVGLCVGFTALVKPLFIFYGLMPIVAIILICKQWRDRLLFCGMLALGITLLIMPWGVRNYLLFHKVPPLAVGGTGTNLTYLLKELEGGESALVQGFKSSSRDEFGNAREAYLHTFIDGAALIEQEGLLAKKAWPEIMRKWPQYLLLICRHIPRLWVSLYSISRNPVIAKTGTLISVFYLSFGLIGMYLLRNQWRPLSSLYLTIILITLMYAPYTAEARYTLPARPILLAFVAGAFVLLWRKIRGRMAWLSDNYYLSNG